MAGPAIWSFGRYSGPFSDTWGFNPIPDYEDKTQNDVDQSFFTNPSNPGAVTIPSAQKLFAPFVDSVVDDNQKPIFVDGSIPSVYIYTDRIFGNRLTNGFPPFTFNSGDNESLVICFYSLYSRRQKGVESWIQGPQLEEGSTATSYVPYGYLPSYKKIIKVNNNPVQLLDKSKYPATTTINGVTFTNNGDGTISVMNGTATSNATYNLMLPINNKTVIGNKYCLVGGAKGGAGNTYFLRYDSDGGMAAYDFGDGVIFTRAAERLAYVNIRVQSGTTANNLFFIPQLYDLTKTFGAGNEPSTVAEFRAKYPNELYEYNPSQIRTAYKKQLITTEGKSI